MLESCNNGIVKSSVNCVRNKFIGWLQAINAKMLKKLDNIMQRVGMKNVR